MAAIDIAILKLDRSPRKTTVRPLDTPKSYVCHVIAITICVPMFDCANWHEAPW